MVPTLWQRIIASPLTVLLAGMAAGAITAPLWRRAARPLVRELMKGGMVVQQEVLRIAEGVREELEDVAAEAKRDLGELPAPAGTGNGHAHNHTGSTRPPATA